MNKRLTFTSGNMAYIINSVLPGGISLGVLLSGNSVVYIYLAFLLCNLLTSHFYRNKGAAARFNVAQSMLITILTAAALLFEYSLFSNRALVDALNMTFKLQARDFISWFFTISVFAVLLLFFSISFICWRHSATRIFPLPVIGRWAWQSAILDDTSGEYASLEEAADKEDL